MTALPLRVFEVVCGSLIPVGSTCTVIVLVADVSPLAETVWYWIV